jgi:hypothetical protein
VLRHDASGVPYLTVYQHLDLTGATLNPGDPVRRGQLLARITDERQVPDPARPHTRHLHFMAAVRGPSFTLPGGFVVPPLWFAIDPFGVYDYYLNRRDRNTYNYIPDLAPDCFTFRIQGATHTIQWASQPLAATIPVSRQTDYRTIIRMQFRVRGAATSAGVPPREREQCLVWLEGLDRFFFVPFDAAAGDRSVELKMIDFLSQCFDRGRKVKLEYYPAGDALFIAAVWAND